jgi:hypothetical protein
MITTLPTCLYELTALSAFLVRLRSILLFILHIAFVQSMAFSFESVYLGTPLWQSACNRSCINVIIFFDRIFSLLHLSS